MAVIIMMIQCAGLFFYNLQVLKKTASDTLMVICYIATENDHRNSGIT